MSKSGTFEQELAPISVIITTLASRAYEYCALNKVYDSELDLLCDVVRHIPRFIEVDNSSGRYQWFIWNETTELENFAEKWNVDPRRAVAFYDWHRKLLADLEGLTQIEGLDVLTNRLGSAFGSAPANRALDGLVEPVSAARRTGRLSAAPVVGLSTGVISSSTAVRANTFHGNDSS